MKKAHNSQNNRESSPKITLDLYFMIIYLCMKYESNTIISSKDDEWKPSYGKDRTDVCKDSLNTTCPPTLPTFKMAGA